MSETLRAGAAVVDVTPPAGLAMAGFAARTASATGTHDPLTVRALAVDDTALVTADVIGLHRDSCRRIRQRLSLPDAHVVITAVHTHGGPRTMPGRLGGHEPAYLARLEDACVEAVKRAQAARRPAHLFFGHGADPGVARNRRRPGEPVDPALPVLRIQDRKGGWIAVVTAYACHPVVLGPDNLLWTADYPGFVRSGLERDHPGAVAVFLTGCAGDANTGHTAHASFSTKADPKRTYAAAEGYATRIVEAVRAARTQPLAGIIAAASTEVALSLERRETTSAQDLAAAWRADAAGADPARAALLQSWIHWAETVALGPLEPVIGRVSVLSWGGVRLVALPGEIFAATALDIRHRLGEDSLAVAFADDCPGYIPPRAEYAHGGYEIDEAHRYYGMPATFAPGSAERLADAAVLLATSLPPAGASGS